MLSFRPFSFVHCSVCSSLNYGFSLPVGIFKLILSLLFVLRMLGNIVIMSSINIPVKTKLVAEFSLNVFYLSQNNKLDRTQVQRTYEVFSYIQFYNNTKNAK